MLPAAAVMMIILAFRSGWIIYDQRHVAAGELFSIAISARQEKWRNTRFITQPDVGFSVR